MSGVFSTSLDALAGLFRAGRSKLLAGAIAAAGFTIAAPPAQAQELTFADAVGSTDLDGAGSVATAVVDGTTYLFATGLTSDRINVYSVADDGTLTSITSVVDDGTLELNGAWSVTAAEVGSTTYIFVAGTDDDGISVFSVASDGSLTNVFNVTDGGSLELDGARFVTTAVVGGTTYLFVAGSADNGISVFSVGTDGTLTNTANVPDAGSLELLVPVAVATAVVDGTTYLFVAGESDSGVSVFSVATNGTLTNVDNVTDNGTLNLNGAHSVWPAVVNGTTYLFAAGRIDAGVSVFSVADDGTLTNVFNVSDNGTLRMADIRAVTTGVVGGTTYLYAAGFSDNGVSVFSVADNGALTNTDNVADDGTLELSGPFALSTAVLDGTTFLFVAGFVDDGITVFSAGDVGGADSTAPRVTSIERYRPDASPALNGGRATWRVTFDEDVQNVTADDFGISGTTGTLSVTTVSASVYDVAVSGGNMAGLNGTITLSVAGGQNIEDLANNALANTTPTGANENTFVLVSDAEAAGNDFVVNSTTTGDQLDPSVAALANGGFIIAYTDESGEDGDGDGVLAQIFASDGTASGSEFVVNSTTAGDQYRPSVATLTNGNFVVAFSDLNGADGDGAGVFARIFGPTGTPAGAQFQVNSTTAATQVEPTVMPLAGGGFAVAFYNTSGASEVRVRIFAADGTPAGNDFSSGLLTGAGSLNNPFGAGLAGGGFAIAVSEDAVGDGSGAGIFARVFDADGTPVAGDFSVNTTTPGTQSNPNMAALANGGFVVAWTDQAGADGQFFGVAGRIFAADGTPSGNQFTLNSTTAGYQLRPEIAGLAGGGFMVAYEDVGAGTNGADGNAQTVVARRFLEDGTADGSDFVVNTTTNDGQFQAAMAGLVNGNFVVAFKDESAGHDDVRARVYTADSTAPLVASIERQTPASSPTNADAVTWRIVFSETVTNIGDADFAVSGTTGTLATSGFTGQQIDVTVSGGDMAGLTGTVTLSFAGGQDITDSAGNALTNTVPYGIFQNTYVLDNTAPTLTAFARNTPASSTTNADTLVWDITFNEAVQNVSADDFEITSTTATGVIAGSGAAYTLTVSGGDLADLGGSLVRLNLDAGQDITDLAGNALPAGEPATDEAYQVDNLPPVLSEVRRNTPADEVTGADTLVFQVLFNSLMNGVAADDFTVSGTTATAAITSGVDGDALYLVTLSGGNLASVNNTTVSLGLSGSADATDTAGNTVSQQAPDLVQTYTMSNPVPPAVSILFGTNPMPEGGVSILSFIIDNTANLVGATALELTHNLPAGVTVSATPNWQTTCTGGTVTAVAGSGTISLSGGSVAAGASCIANVDVTAATAGSYVNTTGDLTSSLGNSGTATATLDVIDATAPRIASIERATPGSSPTDADSLTWTVTFNELAELEAEDLTLTGSTAGLAVSPSIPPDLPETSGAPIAPPPAVTDTVWTVTASGGDLADLTGTVTLGFTGPVLTNTDNVDDDGNAAHALTTARAVTTHTIGGVTYLFVGGGGFTDAERGFSVFSLDGNGDATFITAVRDADDPLFRLFGVYGLAVATINGDHFVYALGRFESGMSVFQFDEVAGTLTNVQNVANSEDPDTFLSVPNDILYADLGAGVRILAVGSDSAGFSTWTVGDDGLVTSAFNFPDDETVFLNRPLAFAGAAAGGVPYIVTGSRVESGLSTFALGLNGSLTHADNLADSESAALHLGAIDAIDTEIIDGTFYIYVASSNIPAVGEPGGISVFTIAPGGVLTNVFNVSGASVGYSNVSDLNAFYLDGSYYVAVRGTDVLAVYHANSDGSLTLSEAFRNSDNAAYRFGGSGQSHVFDIGADPHMAIAGSTSNGFSLFSLANGAAPEDASGNRVANFSVVGTNEPDFELDNTAPVWNAVERETPSGENIGTSTTSVVFRVTFSEDLAGVIGTGDFAAGGDVTGTVTDVTAVTGSSVFDVTVGSLSGDGVLGLTMPGSISDAAGNVTNTPTPQTTTETYARDIVQPRVASIERYDPTDNPTNVDQVVWRVTFDEAVSNLNLADFAVSGTTGTLSHVRLFSNRIEVRLSGGDVADGDIIATLSFAPGQNITDQHGNPLTDLSVTGTNDNNWRIDNAPPAIDVIFTDDTAIPSSTLVTWDISFFENQAGLTIDDFTVETTGSVTVSNLQIAVDNGTSVQVTADLTGSGTAQLTFDANTDVVDDLGNGNGNNGFAPAYDDDSFSVATVDTVAPTLTSIVINGANVTNADTLIWLAQFSEAVSADAADFALTGTTATLSVSTSLSVGDQPETSGGGFAPAPLPTAETWYVIASGGDLADLNGDVTLDLAAAPTIADAYGTPLTDTDPTGSNNNTVTLDNTVVSVTVSGPATAIGAFTVAVENSEPAFGIGLDDFVVTNGSVSTINFIAPQAVTALITPDGAGEVTVTVAEDAVTDLGGNGNAASNTFAVTVDMTAPVLASITRQSPATSPTDADTLTWRLGFNKPVTSTGLGFEAVGQVADGDAGGGGNFALQGAGNIEFVPVLGESFLVSASATESGISVFSIASDGTATFVDSAFDSEDAAYALDGVNDIAHFEIADTNLLIVTAPDEPGLSVFEIAGDGSLTFLNAIRDADNPGYHLEGVRSVVATEVGDTVFVVTASIEESGLNVFELDPDGTLTLVDSLTDADDASYELFSAYALHRFRDNSNDTYIAVTGLSDGGFSVFALAEDGSLTHSDSADDADNPNYGLLGASAVTGMRINGTDYLYVASVGESAINVFSVAGGSLTYVGNVSNSLLNYVTDMTPTFDGDGIHLLATGSFSDSVVSFRVDPDTGLLTIGGHVSDDDDAAYLLDGVGSLALSGFHNENFAYARSDGDNGFSIFELTGLTGVSLTGTTAGVDLADVSGSVDATASGGNLEALNGTVTLTVIEPAAFVDAAGNVLSNTVPTGANDNSFDVLNDADAPGVLSITRRTPSNEYTQADMLRWWVTFDEAVANIDPSDFVVSGTTATVVAISNPSFNSWEVLVSGGDLAALNGAVTLGFAGGQDITDLAGNPLANTTPSGANERFVLDHVAPRIVSIERRTPASEVTNADTLTWRITFDEAMSGIDVTDFTVTGTSAEVVVVSNPSFNSWDVLIAGGDLADLNGVVTLSVVSGGMTDRTGNALSKVTPTGANEASYTLVNDTIAPTIVSITRLDPASPVTNQDYLRWQVVFSENIQNLTPDDFDPAGTSAGITSIIPLAAGLPPLAAGGGEGLFRPFAVSGSTWYITAAGGDLASLNGDVTLAFVAGNDVTDQGGNGLASLTPSGANESYTLDNTAPTAAIASSAAAPVSAPFAVTVSFSEDVSGFDVSDLTVGNGSASNFAVGDARTYTATITPTSAGQVTVDVGAGSANDTAGNGNTAAAQFAIGHDPSRTLTVTLPGAGAGRVTSSPAGIDCGSDCSEDFSVGTAITLTAAAEDGSSFASWTDGPCSGSTDASCALTLNTDTAAAARFTLDEPPAGRIMASTLPAARSGYVGGPVITAFLSVVSRATTPAQTCRVSAPDGAPVTMAYRRLDNDYNPVGNENPIFDLNPGGAAHFVLAFTPVSATGADGYSFAPVVSCENATLDSIVGLNTVLLVIEPEAGPDLVTIGATPSGDGVIRIAGSGRAQIMTVAAVNIGAGDGSGAADVATITMTADTGGVVLPLTIDVCQINTSAQCITPRGPSATVVMTGTDPAFFAIFVRDSSGGAGIPFDPANARVFARFVDATGTTRSATSAAVTAPAAADQPGIVASLPEGRWSVLRRSGDGHLERASVFVMADGFAVSDGANPALPVMRTEGGRPGGFTASGVSGTWSAEGAIRLGADWADAVGEFWGVRDMRGDQPASWIDASGIYVSGPGIERLVITGDGAISGALAGCIVSGEARPISTAAPGLLSADVTLMSCQHSGRYRAVVDLPANDTGRPALIIANDAHSWRIEAVR